jgi:hypothetical protein
LLPATLPTLPTRLLSLSRLPTPTDRSAECLAVLTRVLRELQKTPILPRQSS